MKAFLQSKQRLIVKLIKSATTTNLSIFILIVVILVALLREKNPLVRTQCFFHFSRLPNIKHLKEPNCSCCIFNITSFLRNLSQQEWRKRKTKLNFHLNNTSATHECLLFNSIDYTSIEMEQKQPNQSYQSKM